MLKTAQKGKYVCQLCIPVDTYLGLYNCGAIAEYVIFKKFKSIFPFFASCVFP